MRRLSIIIATFNSAPDIRRCLRSLQQHPPSVDHEVLIVDNASSDETVLIVRLEFPHVRVVPLERNIGFAAANNVGITASHGELLLLHPQRKKRRRRKEMLISTLLLTRS